MSRYVIQKVFLQHIVGAKVLLYAGQTVLYWAIFIDSANKKTGANNVFLCRLLVTKSLNVHFKTWCLAKLSICVETKLFNIHS